MSALPRSWFARDASTLAPLLLNKLIVSRIGMPPGSTRRVTGRIIEVEAYAETDPASHSFRGVTPRTEVMFGRAGHLYVYLSYGIHRCANVVAGATGSGQAVLLRAVRPVDGLDVIRSRRGDRPERSLTDGPGKLCQALGVDLVHDGLDLLARAAPVAILDDGIPPPTEPIVGPRIGITRAVDTPWRFRVPTV